MTVKVWGVILIMVGSWGTGLALAANNRRQEQALTELSRCLQWMIMELRYNGPTLAVLSYRASERCNGSVREVMALFADQLEQQLSPDPAICMNAAVSAVDRLPKRAAFHLQQLGLSLGKFDLENQVHCLQAAEALCLQEMEKMRSGMEIRNRNCRTLSLCAGAVLVMILL